MRKLLLSLFATLALSGCDMIYSFGLYNNSEDSISVFCKYYNDAVERDTLMPDGRRYHNNYAEAQCLPKTKTSIEVYTNMNPFIFFGDNDNNRLDVFIISTDTLEKYGYEEVRKNNRALVRYRFTRMQGLNLGMRNKGPKNLVCYPPTEAMLDYGIDVFFYPEVKNK